MSFDNYPILYTFRRCPYAMRARLALLCANQNVIVREIELKNKPDAMLSISPKGTVPVLQLPSGQIIEESLDIMTWVHHGWMEEQKWQWQPTHEWVVINDKAFKPCLDRYKYFERYPEHSQEEYRKLCFPFLTQLEQQLQQSRYLLGEQPSFIDLAIMPFIRQFAGVNREWFDQSPFPALVKWLDNWLATDLFKKAMVKYQVWQQQQLPQTLFVTSRHLTSDV